jgi:hypothetical protein
MRRALRIVIRVLTVLVALIVVPAVIWSFFERQLEAE